MGHMELDDFKSVLKTKLEEPAQQRSARELEQSIRRRAASIVDKIKRNIVLEIAMSFLFLLLACTGVRNPLLYVKGIFIIIAITSPLFIVYLALLYRKILFYENNTPAVKEGLQQVIDILQRFTRLYFRFTMWILPLVFVLGLVTGYLDVVRQPQLVNGFHWGKSFTWYLALFAAWSVITYFFAKWYIKRLYGNYLEQLKASLEDLENG